ncbi:hypothetical protein CHGG_01306 [Chaetomium globosum CBS 148.51]|uniref:Isotrichodermin C-15 hydroxylase n=1 Tax=Chaetomium globosum (strain ATCC 6205 / CBS 148.51 / DSM 1962 / NBRC 6347 / NRRL 1970) TaxID=306901 RepID=Q2HEP8_CHAGB|nr:uncharacterized protein CHGG_01306 [Chaetomium globosum CBS 148.51]EAQ93071.1 hypothetical protein CHGG_01306 [Chaetomium globosum CBS 148.51]
MINTQHLIIEATSNPTLLIGSVAILLLTYPFLTLTYNLLLHPLRHIPGPLLDRASPLPWAIRHALGTSAFHTERLHVRYGAVVRIAPNHLSFTSPRAWRDIYGSLPRDGSYTSVWPEVSKSKTFTSATDDQEESVIQAGFHEHARLRRALAPGFTDAALRVQERVFRGYVERLVGKIGEKCGGGGGGGEKGAVMDVEKWYNWTTFDIAGELVFGSAFGCLEKEEYHPMDCVPDGHADGGGGDGVDYLSWGKVVEHLLRKVFSNGLVLTLGGSETIATTLCGATYLLLDNPETMKRLSQEVRGSFNNADEITVKALSQLPYLTAAINETLRMYPPVTSDLIRVIPPEGKNIAGHYVTGGTYVEIQQWSINHSPDNWVDPWTFNPDRFLLEDDKAREAGNILEASQPFSWGPRNCLGRKNGVGYL